MTPEAGVAPAAVAAAPRSWGTVPGTLLLAGSLGLVTGGLYGLVTWIQRYGFGLLTWHSRDVIWMAPLANAVIFAGLALMAALPLALFRRRMPAFLTAGVFGFLTLFTLLLPFDELGRWASGLLALGLAVQLARQVRRNPERASRVIVKAGAIMAVLVATLGLGQRGVLALRRALAVRSLPAAASGAPNILLIILDTVRRGNLSLYGYRRPTTPALERRAASGVVFEHAIVTAPWTLPSHGSFLSGYLPEELGESWRKPVRIPGPSLAEVLGTNGYRTAGFVANLSYASAETGLARGFTEYRSYPLTLRQVLLHAPIARLGVVQSLVLARARWQIREALTRFDIDTRHNPGRDFVPAPAITDGFLRWQASLGQRPFFAFLNYFDAHAPYRPPPAFEAEFAAKEPYQDRYDAAIAFLDSELDRLLRELEARGELSRTLVILSSDHGEHFGERGLHGHSNSLYLPALRVPLVLLYPGRVPAGLRVDQVVSLRDIPATILELALGTATASRVPGSSLAATWDPAPGAGAGRFALSRVMPGGDPSAGDPNAGTWLESILDDRFHYIRSGRGAEELYEWRSDSLEQVNLAGSPAGRDIIRRLRARLAAEPGASDQ